mgnify:CR=1 FL=1
MEDSYSVSLGLRECGGGEGLFRFDWGAAESFEGVVHDALSRYRL